MFSRAPSALRWPSWLGRSDRRLLPVILTAIGGVILFWLFAVPQLIRFRFRLGLSWYDLGFHGFGPSQRFVSFDEESRVIEISPAGAQCDQGYTFLAPRGDSVPHPGPMILDARGELVWAKYNWGTTQDFKVQQYKGEDYVTYWQGDEEDGHGRGSWYMLDSTYTPKFMVAPVGDMDGDLHDFVITSNNTALVTIYDSVPADLTSVGGPELGWIYDGVFQELDIATGELLFEWRSLDYFPPDSSFYPIRDRGYERALGYDYIHMNSVDKNDQGHYLVSARHTHNVFCVDGTTGEVLWTLGGKTNEFKDLSNGEATRFTWQHDARWRGPSTITIFDNSANGEEESTGDSRGILLELDISAREVTLATSYEHPQRFMSMSQGNMQLLESGNVLVGWGHSAAFTEYTPGGDIVCDVHFGASAYFTFGRIVSYRVSKGNWVGTPTTMPDAAIADDSLYVSWNGATEVSSWRLEAWDGLSLSNVTFNTVMEVDRTGFETKIPLTSEVTPYFRVLALNTAGEVLGETELLSRNLDPGTFLGIRSWGMVIIVLFAVSCLFSGLYCGVTRYLHKRRTGLNGPYQLVAHKDDDDDDLRVVSPRLPL